MCDFYFSDVNRDKRSRQQFVTRYKKRPRRHARGHAITHELGSLAALGMAHWQRCARWCEQCFRFNCSFVVARPQSVSISSDDSPSLNVLVTPFNRQLSNFAVVYYDRIAKSTKVFFVDSASFVELLDSKVDSLTCAILLRCLKETACV